MKKEIILESKAKYSEMLIDIINKFNSQFPEDLSFEDVIEVSIEAWNLANRKGFLDNKNLYEQELKTYEYKNVIAKIVEYKQKKFNEYNNIIIDYKLEDNRLQIKSQTQEEHFNSFMRNIILKIILKKKRKNQKK